MERGKKKESMGISWADEVEREEQDIEEKKKENNEIEAKANNNNKNNKKPNPFGDARPREVVLEEKGINWRKLDQDLEHNHLILREVVLEGKGLNRRKLDQDLEHNHSILRKNKKLRENNKSLALSMMKQNPKHDMSPIVPPLRYAPKNIMSLMEQIRRGRKDFSDVPVETPCIVKNKTGPQYENQQMHANGRKQVLGDVNFGVKYCNDGDYYGFRNRDANRGSSNGRVRSDSCNMRNEGEDMKDTIRKKRRLSAIQSGVCNQRRERGTKLGSRSSSCD